jgi:hypothetical protein
MNPSTTVLGTLALAVAAVAAEPAWRWTRHLVTLVHEAGHAVLLLLTGHWVKEIVIHDTGGGGTRTGRQPFWPVAVATSFVGYVAPPVAGLFLALGVDAGWNPPTVLAVILVLLIGGVLVHGNWWGLLTMTAIGLVAALFLWHAGTAAQVGVLIGLAWFLLLGGFRRTVEVAGRPAAQFSDHQRLQELTDVPSAIWSFGWLLIAVATLVAGARALLY